MAQALVKALAKEKHQFYLASRNVQRLKPFSQDLQIRLGVNTELVEFDALDFESHKKFYESLNTKPDWVISFFGYLGNQEKAEINWREAKTIVDTNYTAMVSILNIVADDMEKRKNGTIVAISSVAGDRGRRSNYIYGSAKAALTTYLGGMRNRLYESNVHVMTVKPGFVNTQMTSGLDLPKSITTTPERIAKGIVRGIRRKNNTIYLLPVWRIIMLLIKNIPEFAFKKLKL